ncbi:hypothetical protein TWF718_001213 [Orbilia javanica]|uniref:Uncharacterized protein n=1 Tax=Orbilia javanica TaxID=47235 RepID=A0AAN8MYA5_9PEZI
MDDYLISWSLIDVRSGGEVKSHPEHRYPLGHNMWYKNYRLRTLKNSDLRSLPELRFVSSTIMKMVVRRTRDGRTYFRYKGKQNPMGDNTPWSYLQWYPDTRGGQAPHHLLMRFGENAPPGYPVREPSGGCPNPIQYLLHKTDLLNPNPNDNHEVCFFDVPVGIFWGMLGLRSLDRWWVVQDLIEEGDWFRTSPPRGTLPEDFDPTPYQPVNAPLPTGIYLKIRIAVKCDRPELKHSYFRFRPRGDIHVDEVEGTDDEYRTEAGSDYGDSDAPGSDNGDRPAEPNQMQLVLRDSRSHEEQDFTTARQGRSTGSKFMKHQRAQEFYGSQEYEGGRMSLPPDEGYNRAPLRQYHHDMGPMETPSPPSIPASLRLEELYICDTRIEPENLGFGQTNKEQRHLLRHGTGLSIGDLQPSEEEDTPYEAQESHKHRSHRVRRKHTDRDDYMADAPEEHSEYYDYERGSEGESPESEHSERGSTAHSRRDLPIIPGIEGTYNDNEAYHPSTHRALHRESWGYPNHQQGRWGHRDSHRPHHPEEEESFDESVGSPHGYTTSGYPANWEGRFEGHEPENPNMYHFQGSPPSRNFRDRDREDEENEAILVARQEDEERRRRRRKKSAYQESYYRGAP